MKRAPLKELLTAQMRRRASWTLTAGLAAACFSVIAVHAQPLVPAPDVAGVQNAQTVAGAPDDGDAEGERLSLEALATLQTRLRETEAKDPQAAIAAYQRFFEERGFRHSLVAIRVSSLIAQLHAGNLNHPAKAIEIYDWAIKDYGAHLESVRLLAERHALLQEMGNATPLPMPVTIKAPAIGPATPGVATGQSRRAQNRQQRRERNGSQRGHDRPTHRAGAATRGRLERASGLGRQDADTRSDSARAEHSRVDRRK